MKISNDHWLLNKPIAHRGLHTKHKPENTLSAFQNAIDNKHPIELDLQILKDQTIVVFHDFKLTRLCKSELNIFDLCKDDLNNYKILDKEEIPTLEETLNLINNQVPLLIEIKNEQVKNETLHNEILKILKNYNGEFAIQSFNPFTVRYFKKHLPKTPIGLISGSFNDVKLSFIKKIYLKFCLDSFIYKPDFISYEWNYMNGLPNIVHNKFRKIPYIAWTLRKQNEVNQLSKQFSNYIFDNFSNK